MFWNWVFCKILGIEPEEQEISWKTFRLDRNRRDARYVEELTICYEQLLQEHSDSYLYDVDGILEAFNNINLECCELKRELATLEGENAALELQLEKALEWQTTSGLKKQVQAERGYEPTEPEQPREDQSNKFVSSDGRTKEEKQKDAVIMLESGYDLESIAEELGLSKSTARVYLSGMKKHYHVEDENGKKVVCFHSSVGLEKVTLDRVIHVDAEQEEQPEERQLHIPISFNNRGTIVKGLAAAPVNY